MSILRVLCICVVGSNFLRAEKVWAYRVFRGMICRSTNTTNVSKIQTYYNIKHQCK